jgi:hypothetical protein
MHPRGLPTAVGFCFESAAEIWQAPVSGGPPRKLETAIDKNINAFRIHPDGRTVAYVLAEPTAPTRINQIWALENFLPDSK